MRIMLAALLTLASTSTIAEPLTSIEPGSSVVDGTLIEAHTATYTLYARAEDGTETKMQQIRRDVVRSADEIQVSWTTEAQGMTIVDAVSVDGRTLAPRNAAVPTQRAGQIARAIVRFEGATILGHYESMDGIKGEAISTKLERPVFMGSTDAVMLLALPLECGARYRWPTASHSFDSAGWTTAHVTGRTSVRVGQRTLEGWVVELTTSMFAGRVVVSSRAPYVLSKELETPQLTIVWKPD